MVKIIDKLLKRPEKRLSACIDTCFIEGTFLKLIEKESWRIRIKEDRRLKELNESNCLLLINDLNVYEIKNSLKKFNVPINRINQLYEEGRRILKCVKKIEAPAIKINNSLIIWMLENDLDFRDGLLINIAQKLELPFITSEKNAIKWKKAYEGVMSQEDFWKELEKYRFC